MSSEEEILMRDVTNAGLVVSDRIGREVASQLDVEEALEASRYASHPYTTHPREVHCWSKIQCILSYLLELVCFIRKLVPCQPYGSLS